MARSNNPVVLTLRILERLACTLPYVRQHPMEFGPVGLAALILPLTIGALHERKHRSHTPFNFGSSIASVFLLKIEVTCFSTADSDR